MFWYNKPKLPITEDDKNWIEFNLLWLSNEFGQNYFKGLKTVTPTIDFLDHNFNGTESDAEYLLVRDICRSK
jgi:hypothetical protein